MGGFDPRRWPWAAPGAATEETEHAKGQGLLRRQGLKLQEAQKERGQPGSRPRARVPGGVDLGGGLVGRVKGRAGGQRGPTHGSGRWEMGSVRISDVGLHGLLWGGGSWLWWSLGEGKVEVEEPGGRGSHRLHPRRPCSRPGWGGPCSQLDLFF